jgi:GT2 family glycosyltransferase
MIEPKISVVTVSFNQGEFIRQNIESVLAQNYTNFEHIIVDGGSTDNTVDILKSYHHLKWTSEPDRGQTDALNKGFSKATGDIIAWLNSDDWYPPNIFHQVVAGLEDNSLVIGMCAEANREGKQTEVFPNQERTWFDILKYWIYYSIPAQPSIFFKREVLDEIVRHDGKYLDEDLEFGMDYEFWLRITRSYDLANRIPTILSYARMYEENKTGRDMASAYAEYSRVFCRHANLVSCAERKISLIIPVSRRFAEVGPLLESLAGQTLMDFEALLVGYCDSPDATRRLKKQVIEFSGSNPKLNVRFIEANQADYWAAVNTGIERSCASVLAFLNPQVRLDSDFCFETSRLFQKDIVSFTFPFKNNPELYQTLSLETEQGRIFNVQSLFSNVNLPSVFIARKVALLEIAGFRFPEFPGLAVRDLIFRLIFKGWAVNPGNQIGLTMPDQDQTQETERLSIFNKYINAQLICILYDELVRDPMGETRAAHGYSISFPEDLVKASTKFLERAPENWFKLDFLDNIEKLQVTTRLFPKFSPAWYFLSQAYKEAGDQKSADQIYSSYLELRREEDSM